MKPSFVILAVSALLIAACASSPKRRELSELSGVEMFYNSIATNDPVERARVDAMIGKLVDYLRSIQKE